MLVPLLTNDYEKLYNFHSENVGLCNFESRAGVLGMRHSAFRLYRHVRLVSLDLSAYCKAPIPRVNLAALNSVSPAFNVMCTEY